MGGTTICALADGAAMPLRSYLEKFREEFEYYIEHGKSMVDGTALETEIAVHASH
jgi:NADH-quinone oxidoreductase subunit F